MTAPTLPVFTEVVQTCRACPSQWDAWDQDGQYYYLRYRYGRGIIEKAADDSDQALMAAELVVNFQYGGRLEGEITLDEFLRQATQALQGDTDD